MQALRPDRIATLYFFHPLQRLLRRASTGIPILMYHSISEGPEARRSAYFHTCTSPRVFREHLQLLARNGYKTIGLGEAVRKLERGAQTTERLVVLTFDDGFADFYTEAFPALSALGYTATVFLPTAYIGDSLEPGDVIYALNKEPVTSVEALKQVLNSLKPADPVVLQVQRDNKLRYVTLSLGIMPEPEPRL